jgi:quaternary ammonium compound-resistance protein SugE
MLSNKTLFLLYSSEMNWIYLIIAGLFEAGFAICLGKAKEATGSVSAFWLAGFFICLTISMLLLYKATQTLPIGTAYAVWTGIGAAGTVLAGIILFREPTDFWRMFFIATLIASIIGLKAVSN